MYHHYMAKMIQFVINNRRNACLTAHSIEVEFDHQESGDTHIYHPDERLGEKKVTVNNPP